MSWRRWIWLPVSLRACEFEVDWWIADGVFGFQKPCFFLHADFSQFFCYIYSNINSCPSFLCTRLQRSHWPEDQTPMWNVDQQSEGSKKNVYPIPVLWRDSWHFVSFLIISKMNVDIFNEIATDQSSQIHFRFPLYARTRTNAQGTKNN